MAQSMEDGRNPDTMLDVGTIVTRISDHKAFKVIETGGSFTMTDGGFGQGYSSGYNYTCRSDDNEVIQIDSEDLGTLFTVLG